MKTAKTAKRKNNKAVEETGFVKVSKIVERNLLRITGSTKEQLKQKDSSSIVKTSISNATRLIQTNFQHLKCGSRCSKKSNCVTPSQVSTRLRSEKSSSSFISPSVKSTLPINSVCCGLPQDDDALPLPAHSPHKVLKHSTQTLMYGLLLPLEAVKLVTGAEIIIVMPAPPSTLTEKELTDYKQLRSKFETALLDSFVGLNSTEKKEQLQVERNKHRIDFQGKDAYEFACRVTAYPGYSDLAVVNPPDRVIEGLWKQGSGFHVEVCGYSPRTKVLVMHRMLPFIKIYKLRDTQNVVDEIAFPFPKGKSTVNMGTLLAQNLAVSAGDSMKSLQVMLHYYKSLSKKLQLKLLEASQLGNVDKPTDELIHDSLVAELDDDKLREFAQQVEDLYRKATERLYSGFYKLKAYLISRDDIADLYEEMRASFPTAHMVFSLIVSSAGSLVALADCYQKLEKKSNVRSVDATILQSDDDDSDFEVPDTYEEDFDFPFHELEVEEAAVSDAILEVDVLEKKQRAGMCKRFNFVVHSFHS